jgi:hypothetical protein
LSSRLKAIGGPFGIATRTARQAAKRSCYCDAAKALLILHNRLYNMMLQRSNCDHIMRKVQLMMVPG